MSVFDDHLTEIETISQFAGEHFRVGIDIDIQGTLTDGTDPKDPGTLLEDRVTLVQKLYEAGYPVRLCSGNPKLVQGLITQSSTLDPAIQSVGVKNDIKPEAPELVIDDDEGPRSAAAITALDLNDPETPEILAEFITRADEYRAAWAEHGIHLEVPAPLTEGRSPDQAVSHTPEGGGATGGYQAPQPL